jgi:hypothetical protein
LEGSGNEPVGAYTCLYGKENENHELGTGFIFSVYTGWALRCLLAGNHANGKILLKCRQYCDNVNWIYLT